MDISKYNVLIFDCDGVIIDSNLMKVNAFGKSVREYPPIVVDRFVEHCKNTFGISRYIKFKEFFNDFAHEPFNEEKYNTFLMRYEQLCKELYDVADFTPGLEKVLTHLNNQGSNLYVASGSDELELIDVFKRRKLFDFFEEIYGSPKNKTECIYTILENNNGLKTAFIGDSISDLSASIEHNLDFIYMPKYTVQSKEQDEICRNKARFIIDTLEDLL